MKRPLLAGAALGVIAFLAPQIAAADCEKMMMEAAQAMASLPDGTDSRVHDRLNEFYAEAEEHMGTDEAACMVGVRKMQDLIRRSGGTTEEVGAELTLASATGAGGGGGGGGGSRAGFVPITPDDGSSASLESRIGGLSPAAQRDARALNDYAAAARAAGSAIVNGAASPTPEVNAVAKAANDAVEMAGAARDAMIAERNRFDTMVRDLLGRLQGAQQDFQIAIQAGAGQVSAGAEAQVEAAKQQLAEANQRVDAVHERAQRAADADLGEGMAPGFAEAYRRMTERHQRQLARWNELFDKTNSEHDVALAFDAINGTRRAQPIKAKLDEIQAEMTDIRKRQAKEEDDLWLRYSTVVIDLTQPDGVPQPGRSRPSANDPDRRAPHRPEAVDEPPPSASTPDRSEPHTPEPAGQTPPAAEVRSIEEEAAELQRQKDKAARDAAQAAREAEQAAEMRAATQLIATLEQAQANGDRSPETAQRLEEARHRLRVAIDHEGAPTASYDGQTENCAWCEATPDNGGQAGQATRRPTREEEARDARLRQLEAQTTAEIRAAAAEVTALEQAQANGDRSQQTSDRLAEARQRLDTAMDWNGTPGRNYGVPSGDPALPSVNDPYTPWQENPSAQRYPETPMAVGGRPVSPPPNHSPADGVSRSASEQPPADYQAPNYTPGEVSTAPPEPNHTPAPPAVAAPEPPDDLLAPLIPRPRAARPSRPSRPKP